MKSELLSTPTKENSPSKSSTFSMGKLDLSKVDSQKGQDEEGQIEEDNGSEKIVEPLISERELEEIHEKN